MVLVVEDDPQASAALELTLRDWGAEVSCGDAAESLMERLGPRVREAQAIIADFDLGPKPDGVVAASRLRELAPRAQVLVLSGAFNTNAAHAAASAGYDFMAKPASADAITDWLVTAGVRGG